jgi:Tol biopolymer transport system component
MKEITHKQARSYLQLDLDRLLGDAQRLDLEAHLAGCEACRAEVQSFSTLTSRLQSEFHERWDAHDGPSQHVTANVRSQTRRIIMSNKVNLGLRALGGVAVLVVLGFVVNFVISQLRGQSVAANGTPASDNSMPAPPPTPSPESRLIAFTKEVDGNFEIFTVRADGTGLTNLTNSPSRDDNPYWSPDGKRIAFNSDRDGIPQIYVMDADGSDISRVTEGEYANKLVGFFDGRAVGMDFNAWSPDGSKLLYMEIISPNEYPTLSVVDLATEEQTPLVSGRLVTIPSWSPDGEHVAFISTGADPMAEITRLYAADLDGGSLFEVTGSLPASVGIVFNYDWSGNGRFLSFAAMDATGEASFFYEAGLDGTLTERTSYRSPESQVLYWRNGTTVLGTPLGNVIWLRPDGAQTELELCPGGDVQRTAAKPSSRGEWIYGAFCSSGEWMVYWANSDGTNIQKILNVPVPSVNYTALVDLAWSPDDRFVAFNIAVDDTTDLTEMYILDVVKTLADPSTPPVRIDAGNVFRSRTGARDERVDSLSWQPMMAENLLVDEGLDIESSPQAGRRLLAFTMERNGNTDVYTVRADGSDLTNLTGDSNGSNPYWSPDGKRIAFNRTIGSTSKVFLMDADGSNFVQLTDDGDFNKLVAFEEGREFGFDAWSPDGRKLVIVKFNDDRTNIGEWMKIYVLDVETKIQTPLTSDWGGYQSPAWSPDGEHIAFTSITTDEQGEPKRVSVQVVGADGNNLVDLTESLPDDEFSSLNYWSLDGQSVFFTSRELASKTEKFHEAKLDGSLTELSKGNGARILDWWEGTALLRESDEAKLTWLRPDGTRSTLDTCPDRNQARNFSLKRSSNEDLFLGAQCSPGEWRLYLSSEDGGAVQEVLDAPLYAGDGAMIDQAWSPDDNFIAFNIAHRSGDVELFILDVVETLNDPTLEPVWFEVGHIFSSVDSLSWQPVITEETLAERPPRPYEGLVAFTSAVENGNLDIYIMRPDGSGLTNLTNDPAHDVDPYWSPDGKRIAFLSDRAGYMQIFTMNADGSDVFQLTHREADHEFASANPWSPDGSLLVFFEQTPDGKQILYTMQANGRNGLPLVSQPNIYGSVSWSPDGTHIAYVVVEPVGDRDVARIHVTEASGDNNTDITRLLPADEDIVSWNYSWNQRGRSITFVAGQFAWENTSGRFVVYEASLDGNKLTEITVYPSQIEDWWGGTAFIQGFDGTTSTLTWLRSDGTTSTVRPFENCQSVGALKSTYKRSSNGILTYGAQCANGDLWLYWASPNGTEIKQLLEHPLPSADGSLVDVSWSPDDNYIAINIVSSGITYMYVLDIDDALKDASAPPEPIIIGGGDLYYNVSWQPMP